MTDHDEAARIARKALARWFPFSGGDTPARDTVAALDEHGLLARPGELAALRALHAAVKSPDRAIYVDELDALAALDAAPAAKTTSGIDPDYPDVSGGGVPYLPVEPPEHPI